jgi:hypothetical protein
MRPRPHAQGVIPALLVAREELIEDLQPGPWGNGSAAIAGQTFTWRLDSRVPDVHVLRVEPQWYVPANLARPAQPLALASELPAVHPTLYDARGTPLLRRPNLKVLGPARHEWSFQQRLTLLEEPAKPADGGAQPVAVQPPPPPPPSGPPARIKFALPTVTREIAIPFKFAPPPAPAPAPAPVPPK